MSNSVATALGEYERLDVQRALVLHRGRDKVFDDLDLALDIDNDL